MSQLKISDQNTSYIFGQLPVFSTYFHDQKTLYKKFAFAQMQ